MISLEIEGRKVDLPPDAKISFKLSNPLFNDDGFIPGDFSFPFDLLTPEQSEANAEIFNHLDVLEATGEVKKDATIFFDDITFKKGKVKVISVSDTLSVNFIAGIPTIADDIKSRKIKDLVAENIVMSPPSVAKKIYLKPGGRFNFAGDNPIKVNGRTYDGATLTALVSAINVDITLPRATATLVNTGSSPGGLAAPYITLVSTAAANDAHAELSVDEDISNRDFTDGWIWQVEAELPGYYAGFDSFYSSYKTNAPATNKFRIPVGQNEYYFVEGSGERILTNVIEGGNFRQNKPTDDTANWSFQFYTPLARRNNLQPFVMVRHIFEKAATYFNIGYEGDWVGQPFYNSLLIHNTNPIGFTQPFVGKSPFLFWAFSFNLSDLVPDITFLDLLKALQNRYNLKIAINEKTGNIVIKQRKPIVESNAKRDLTSAGVTTRIDDQRITGVRLGNEKTEDLLRPTDYFDVGMPEIEIKSTASEVSTTGVSTTDFPFGVTGFGYKMQDNKTFPLRLMTYAFATVPRSGVPRTLATIYIDEYKRFIQQRINRKVIQVPLYWGMAELSALDFDEKIQYDRNDYFIAFLDVELMMDDIIIMATLYKC